MDNSIVSTMATFGQAAKGFLGDLYELQGIEEHDQDYEKWAIFSGPVRFFVAYSHHGDYWYFGTLGNEHGLNAINYMGSFSDCIGHQNAITLIRSFALSLAAREVSESSHRRFQEENMAETRKIDAANRQYLARMESLCSDEQSPGYSNAQLEIIKGWSAMMRKDKDEGRGDPAVVNVRLNKHGRRVGGR